MAAKMSGAIRAGGFGKGRRLVPPCALAAGLAAALAAPEAKAQAVFQCPTASPPADFVGGTIGDEPELQFGVEANIILGGEGGLTDDQWRELYGSALNADGDRQGVGFRRPVAIPTAPIECGFVDASADRAIVVLNPRITVTEDWVPGIYGWHQGSGNLVIYAHSVDPTPPDSPPNGPALPHAARHFHPLDHGRYAARTSGDGDYNTGEESHGIQAEHTGEGVVGIDFRNLSLSTAGGDFAVGIYASQRGSYVWVPDDPDVPNGPGTPRRAKGAVVVNVIETERDRASRARPLIGTRGDDSDAIRAEYTRAAAFGHVVVTVEGYTLATGGIVPPGPQIPNTGEEGGELLPSLRGNGARGIYAFHGGHGDIRIATTDSHILTWGLAAHGIFAHHEGKTERITNEDRSTEVRTGGGAIDIAVTEGEIRTAGANSIGIYGRYQGSFVWGAGGVKIDTEKVTVATAGDGSHGILAWIHPAREVVTEVVRDKDGNVVRNDEGDPVRKAVREQVRDKDGNLVTDEDGNPVWGDAITIPITGTGVGDVTGTGVGDVDIDFGGDISTKGEGASAIWAKHENIGNIDIDLKAGATLATTGERSHGIFAEHTGTTGNVAVTGGAVTTQGDGAYGVRIQRSGDGNLNLDVRNAAISTQGAAALGIQSHLGGDGNLDLDVTGGTVATRGENAHGVQARLGGDGGLTLDVTGATVTTQGSGAHGVSGVLGGTGDLTLDVTGATVAAEGEGALGIYAVGGGEGDVSVVIGGDASITSTGEDGIAVLVRHSPLTVTAGGTGGAARSVAAVLALPADGHGEGTVSITVGEDARVAGTGTGISVSRGGEHRAIRVDGVVTGGTGPAIYLENGGAVTVGANGRVEARNERRHAIVSGITGETDTGNHLTVTVAGRVVGNITVQDDSDLELKLDGEGTVVGSLLTVGGGTLTIPPGFNVTGTIYNPQSPYTVGFTVGRLIFTREDGAVVTITESGRITGVNGEAIRNDDGGLAVELQGGQGEDTILDALVRLDGTLETSGDLPAFYWKPYGEDRQRVGVEDSAGAVAVDAWDVALLRVEGARYRVGPYYAPRTRAYEALPSALLRLNRLAPRDRRLAAPRAENGAWAVAEAGKGAAQASRSTTAVKASGSDYDYRRYGVRAGMEVPVNDDGLALGVSVHHLTGDVDLAGDVAGIDASGTGFGFSGSWESGTGAYVDGQFQATLWEASLASGARGNLASDVRGIGYAAGIEIGHRYAMGMSGVGDLTLLPRASLVHSQVDMSDFVDRVTDRSVSLEKSRSLRGRAGVGVETAPPGPGAGRLFAALEVEREFEPETQVVFAGTTLDSTAESTWVRVELGAAREWQEGRYALQGRLNYATASGDNHDYGGDVSLKLRF